MHNDGTLDELKDLGSGRPASDEATRLYREAFGRFRTRALWSWRTDIERPTYAQVLAIADALRTEGNVEARALAAAIEQACRAAL